MNDQTKQAIDVFVEFTPKDIDAPIHCTDRNRVFDIAIAAFNEQEALSDVYDSLSDSIKEEKFKHADTLIPSVKHDIGLLVEFLKYQQRK